MYPELSYNEALEKARLPKLAERRDMLCSKLFKDMVSDPDHKLAYLLPKKLEKKNLERKELLKYLSVKLNNIKTFVVTYTSKYNDV